MATCDTSACRTDNSPERSVRVLRWTFRRQKDAIVCELGLNIDGCAYELRVDPAWNPAGVTTELFDDAMSAFERHATIERMLVEAGWMLEGFESGYRSARPFQ
jgi:hypothetical protein